jgi:hypothetical protein
MITIGLIKNNSNSEEFGKALESLDLLLRQKLTEDEKNAMGYNIVMLEHTLCKFKRLTKKFSLQLLQSEIN